MRVLCVVEVGAAVEGRGGRGIGVRAGWRRRAGGTGEDGRGGRRGVVRRPEEHGHLEGGIGVVGVRIRVSGWRRHGRRQWSRSGEVEIGRAHV